MMKVDSVERVPYLPITLKMNSKGSSKFGMEEEEVDIRRRRRRRKQFELKATKREMFCISTFVLSVWWLLLLLQNKGLVRAVADWAPRITIQPNDLIAIEGESAELNCDADGQPEPTIEWYHNGQLIKASTHSRTTMGGSIQFLDIRPALSFINGTNNNNNNNNNIGSKQQQHESDAGIYYCLARNSLGQARSRNATLQVAYIKQEFRSPLKDKLVSIGETVTFDCLPQAWPEPNIQWRHNGQLIEPHELRLADGSAKYSINRIAKTDLNVAPEKLPSMQSAATTNTEDVNDQQQQLIDVFGSRLVIKDVDKGDEGKYSCLVETKGSHRMIERESPSAQLRALVKPYFIEAPEHKSVEVGSQVKLKCRMGGDPEPVISWRKQNGQPLSEKTQIDAVDKTLILDKVSVADQAVYVCEGENSIGSARTLAKLSVNSRPKFIVQPENQEVDQGSRVQLKCSGEASPPPMLFWYKEGHRQLMFAPTASTSLSTSSKQTSMDQWPHASPLVAQDYRSSSPLSDISPAVNKLFSMPLNADQLHTSNFGNNYFGNRIYVDNQGTLNLINVTSSDTGYYACALISSVGSVMAKAKLSVKQSLNSPPSASDYYNSAALQDTRTGNSISKFDLLPPPVIKFGSANQTLPTNTSANLVCDVVSQVAYKIQWLFESQTLQEEPGRIVVLETGSLSINNLKTSDSGIYTCVVTAANDQVMPLAAPFEPLDASMLTSAPPIQQSTSHSTMLKVASPMISNIQFYRMDPYAYPSAPGPAYLVSTNGNDAITIAWLTPAESGSLPIKEYVVEHYDTAQEHLGWKIIYRIKGKESLLIDGLSPDGSHFFVIRAANSHGTGPSSAIAGPMRTVAGEARYQAEQRRRSSLDGRKFQPDAHMSTNMQEDRDLIRERLKTISTNLLSVTAVSSSSIRLQWSTQAIGNLSTETISGLNIPLMNVPDVADFMDGYSILYRAVGMGESLLSKDPPLGLNWNTWSNKEVNVPSSLPLVTSYIDEEPITRKKRDLTNYFDNSKDYSEVRVVDHNTEHYTINGLRPFTVYQFFVTPYYKDIDGIPSNFLTAQTNEDKPDIAPPSLTVRPINNTAIKLLWLSVPPPYTNGILRGYIVRLNRSDILINNGQSEQQILQQSEAPKVLNLPLSSLGAAPLTTLPPETRIQPNNFQSQYIVIYDLTNLTYKSFYSIQVAATTTVGPGPWSEPLNLVMDPKVLAQLRGSGNEFDDVMSKSLISTVPQTYGNIMSPGSNLYLIVSISLIIISIITLLGYLLYRRNNQKVITWKKTISEHFTNKFYMPSVVDHRGTSSIQQNIYDHQQHLIYSGAPHMTPQSIPSQTLWANSNCINSSGTGSISSHGGLIPISTDPNSINGRLNNDQVLMMNKTDMNSKFAKSNLNQLVNQPNIDSSRPLINQTQANKQHGDYYSVISNMAEYEELDNQQRSNMQLVTNADRHQTASSNSDTSCPSSVTRLLPNQNYNRDLMTKNLNDMQRHEMVLQQQVICTDAKQPFATMTNSDISRMQPMVPLSPYATTNLMNQAPMHQHMFSNNQTSLIDHSRQQNFVLQNGGLTMDDSSKALINHHHQINGVHNPISVFRTLQRNPMNFQARNQQFSPAHHPQTFIQGDNNFNRYPAQSYASGQASSGMTNITTNPLNVYEHIEYTDSAQNQHPEQSQQKFHQLNSQTSNHVISSSTSSGSMKSSQHHSPDQQPNSNKLRRGSDTPFESEAHDLHVFSTLHDSSFNVDSALNEKQRFNGDDQHLAEEYCQEEETNHADETTAFRQKTSQSENQRARQLSKRKRQQQRNRLHNNNQKID